jgi:hypothetical protein
MTLGALALVRFVTTPYQWFLFAAAIVGTAGLIWSLTNYSRRSGLLVLAALSIGIVGILVGGVGGAIGAFANDVYNHRSLSPIFVMARTVLVGWLVLGPAAVGIVQARQSILRMRAATI